MLITTSVILRNTFQNYTFLIILKTATNLTEQRINISLDIPLNYEYLMDI